MDRGPDRKELIVGNERVAVPRAARQECQRMAVRYRGGQGRSAAPAHRSERTRRDPHPRHLRHRAADLRAQEPRRQTRRRLRAAPGERSGLAERVLLGGRARRAAQPARAARRGGRRGRPLVEHRGPGCAGAFPRLLLPCARCARRRRGRRREELPGQRRVVGWLRAGCLAGAGRRDRDHDLHRQPGRRRVREGSRRRHGQGCRQHHDLQPRFDVGSKSEGRRVSDARLRLWAAASRSVWPRGCEPAEPCSLH